MQRCQRPRHDPRAGLGQPEARAATARHGGGRRRPAGPARRGRAMAAPMVRAGEPLEVHLVRREVALEPRVGPGVAQRVEGTARARVVGIATTPVRAAPGARRGSRENVRVPARRAHHAAGA